MKIINIINSLGDSGQYFLPFFEGLIHRGHQIIVISPTISPLMYSKLARIGVDYMNLGRMRRGLSSLLGLISFPLILARIIRIVDAEKISLIHVHSDFIPLLLGCIVSNFKKIPLILTIHGGQPSFSFKLNPIRSINGIISTSLERKEALPEGRKGVAVIPLPVDLERFFPNSTKRAAKDHGRQISLFNSGSPNNAVYSILESAKKISLLFRNSKITISGWYSNYYDLVNRISKKNEEIGREMIVQTGFIEDTPKVMNEADIVIGVGVVVAEAMACGKPVIVARSHYGGIVSEQNVAELRKYNFTGRNSNMQTNPENIFKSINRLLNDAEYMKHLSEFGRRYAEKEFEPNRIIKQVEMVYKNAQESLRNATSLVSLLLAGHNILGSMLYLLIKELSVILKISHTRHC